MRTWWLIIVCLLLVAGSADLRGQAQEPSRYFAETGHTVRGAFLAYWEQHGGLAQQGYPISEELTEISDLDGKPYTMQYFERAVFERHPDNAPPYDVLLSQLGTFQYRQKYPQGAPDQQAQTGPDSRGFPQTGHRVGGRFLAYWEQHGGLDQQGYPISDEFAEKSALDGQTYTVQYFERAVFEWHPDNQPPYDVLLSQLGTLRSQARYGVPAPTATPSPEPGEVVDQLISRKVFGAVAAGEFLFWDEAHDSNTALYGYDHPRQEQFVITDTISRKYGFTTDGQALAWADAPPRGKDTIWWYDPRTRQTRRVLEGPLFAGLAGLALDDEMLYYAEYATAEIYAYNLRSGQTQFIVTGGYPVAANGNLLWSTQDHPDNLGHHYYQISLHLRTAGHPQENRIIAQDTDSLVEYTLAGDHVGWAYFVPAQDTRAMVYTISTQTRTILSTGQAVTPVLNERWAAWSERGALHLADLQTGNTTVLRQGTQILMGSPVGFVGSQTLAYIINNELHLAAFGPIP